VEWLRDFRPDSELRSLVLDAIRAAARERAGDEPERRRDPLTRLDRLQDLYVMGDLTKSQYVMRRQALEEEVERIGPPVDPDIARAEALPDDFAQFWTIEDTPAERHSCWPSSSSASGKTAAASSRSSPARRSRATFRPSPTSRPSEKSPKLRREFRGVKGGSDGTRTRDLRRDRPVMALAG
jgi:hypothetical protein